MEAQRSQEPAVVVDPYRTAPKNGRYFRMKGLMIDLADMSSAVWVKEGYARVFTRSAGMLAIQFDRTHFDGLLDAWEAYVHGQG